MISFWMSVAFCFLGGCGLFWHLQREEQKSKRELAEAQAAVAARIAHLPQQKPHEHGPECWASEAPGSPEAAFSQAIRETDPTLH